jgi:hypothetical protein
MIVYPSYGIGGSDATMLVSYSWSQDALRLGTFVRGGDSLAESRMIDLILGDLSKVHDIPLETLKAWKVDHHAYNWYDNEYTVGEPSFRTLAPKAAEADFGNRCVRVLRPKPVQQVVSGGYAAGGKDASVLCG